MDRCLRYESASPDAAGRRAGLFALLRDLRRSGRLAPDDEVAARAMVARSYELHDEPPATAYPAGALSWFLADADSAAAEGLRVLCADVVEMLARYDIAVTTLSTHDPGEVTYRDDVQVVAVPRAAP